MFSYQKWPFKDPSISKSVYLRSLNHFYRKEGLLPLWNSSNVKALSYPICSLSEGTKWRFWFALPGFPTQLLASSTWHSRAFPLTRFTNWTPSLESLWAHSWCGEWCVWGFGSGPCGCVWSPVAPTHAGPQGQCKTDSSNLTISEKIWSGSVLSNIKVFCKFAPGFKPKHGVIIQPIVAKQDTSAWF